MKKWHHMLRNGWHYIAGMCIKGSKHEINETIVSYVQDIDLGKNQYKIIGKVKISKLLIVKVEGQEKSIELNSLLVERTLNQGLLIK